MGMEETWPGPVVHKTVPMGSCLQLALYTQRHLAVLWEL